MTFTRRNIVLGGLLLAFVPTSALAQRAPRPRVRPRARAGVRRRRNSNSRARSIRPRNVNFRGYAVGTLVVDPRRRNLYFVTSPGRARRYKVGVGRAGLAFRGRAVIGRKAVWPRWTPTRNMIRREPDKYAKYANGVPGGPGNPLGARALYLYRNGRDTLYRIHGTNNPASIGGAVSNGCIRMLNAHVVDLYRRVPVGARVVVL